jgi:hypothetical protein
MKQFKYKLVTKPSMDELEELGYNGWELVGIESSTQYAPAVYVFKTEITSAEEMMLIRNSIFERNQP